MIGRAVCWIDGKLVRADRASLPLTDLSVSRGYGAFEALRTYHGKPFLLEAHLQRFEATCRHLCLRPPLSRKALREVVAEVLQANGLPESLVRIYLTGGDAGGFLPEGNGRLLILADPVKPYPEWQYERGIALKTTPLQRSIPLAKTLDYTAGIRETILARRDGFQEIVFTNGRGHLLEGAQFNIAAVRGRRVISPVEGVLKGTTVEHLLKLAGREGFTISREPLTTAQVKRADELFITSTTRELLPVVRLDDIVIGAGTPGPVFQRLRECFRKSAVRAARKI
ncbi:MAG TPA: aminotransferase class IV [Chthoniobacteraceae bacterium]|nr:aminotransferase class IV [Chthoniobacteraceae bacterium]